MVNGWPYYLLCVITRKVYIAGCTRYPVAFWVKQQARNFSMHLSDIGMKCKYLIHDNDTSFIALDSVLKAEGVKIVKTPVHTPVCNCYAERFVKEVRETLDKLILFGDRQLYNTMKVVEKYHNEYRPHQGIANSIPENYDYPEKETNAKEVKCMFHLGGLLKHYYAGRKAA